MAPQLESSPLRLLYDLAEAVSRAENPNGIFRAAVERFAGAVADRASILTFDADDVMRYRAWKGISPRHRARIEARVSDMWRRGDRTAQPVLIPDVTCDASVAGLLPTLNSEGIRALALIPLMGNGGLIGKFVLYYDTPHDFQPEELGLIQTASAYVAFAAERQLAATALRESQERYQEVFDNSADGIFLVAVTSDLRFKFIEFNPVIEMVTGLLSAEVSGRFVEDVLPERRASEVIAKYRECVDSGSRVAYEEELTQAIDHRTFHVLLSPVRNADGRIHRIIGVARDVTEQRRKRAELRTSEEKFRMMANTAPVMIWTIDTDKLCTFVNKAWLDFRGRPLEQELGNGWADGLHPEDRNRGLELFSFQFNARKSFTYEYRLQRFDGQYRWVIVNGRPFYADDTFAGYIGSCVDITDQKTVEQRLRRSRAQLMEGQRLAHVASWERDLGQGISNWSEEMFKILGLAPDVSPSLSLFVDCTHPKDRDKITKTERDVCANRGPVESEYRIVRPDGEVRFVRSVVEATRNDQNLPVRLTGAIQDITEQVEARELLRQSERRLRNAERLARLGHWHWDLISGQVIWSEECYGVFGQPRSFAPSYEVILEMLVPQDREHVRQGTRRLLTEKQASTTTEFQIVRPDGELRMISTVSELVLDEEDRPVSMFGTCQDITEARRTEVESMARQKLESVGTLASGIAHDFNNLLGGVLAQAELASARSSESPPDEELEAIKNLAIRGSEIVRQLMIYAGNEKESIECVDASLIVSEMLALLKVSVSKRAAFVTDLATDLPPIHCNAGQLRQIVMNLVTNASEALTDKDGVIRVTTARATLGGPAISDIGSGDYIQLEVSDTGRGIPADIRARIFDPFFSTKSTGRGLGLSVVDGIVRGLGGIVRVASEPGEGTTVRILFPIAETTAGRIDAPMSPKPRQVDGSRTGTVLVVEDENPLREAVSKMLRRIGYEVVEAANGNAAIEFLHARSLQIDALLLDLHMPGASYGEVMAAAVQTQPKSKVILTSAYSEQIAVAMANTSEVHRFIRKPFRLSDLVQTIDSALLKG